MNVRGGKKDKLILKRPKEACMANTGQCIPVAPLASSKGATAVEDG